MANKSEQLKLNWRDIGRGLIMAVLGAAVASCQQLLSTGMELNKESARIIGMSALTACVAYIVKNFFSNSQGKFLTQELTPEPVQFNIFTENQTIVKINGSPVNKTIQQFCNDNPAWAVYDSGSSIYYPTLYNMSFAHPSTMEFSVDGSLNSQIITGTHPPHRPR